MSGVTKLMAELSYGSGLRLLECCRLRIKDLDLERREIVVRRGKGDRDRRTMVPQRLVRALERHREKMHEQHQRDLVTGAGYVELPHALRHKYVNAVLDRAVTRFRAAEAR